MYSWLRAENSAADHPKVMALATALGCPEPETALALADGYVFRLWCWVHRYKPTGEFSASVVPQLERYIGRAGVIALMVREGLVDAVSDGFCVHDWEEMQGGLVEKASRDAKMKRASRRQNGARPARAGRSNGARAARLQDKTRQDKTRQDTTDRTGPTGQEEGRPVSMAPTPDDLLQVWNTKADTALPRALEINDDRRKRAKERLKERSLPHWLLVVERINASDFCRGQNERGWVATFDWLLQPDTATKVLEGKYDNRGPAPPKPQLRDVPTEYPEGRARL